MVMTHKQRAEEEKETGTFFGFLCDTYGSEFAGGVWVGCWIGVFIGAGIVALMWWLT